MRCHRHILCLPHFLRCCHCRFCLPLLLRCCLRLFCLPHLLHCRRHRFCLPVNLRCHRHLICLAHRFFIVVFVATACLTVCPPATCLSFYPFLSLYPPPPSPDLQSSSRFLILPSCPIFSYRPPFSFLLVFSMYLFCPPLRSTSSSICQILPPHSPTHLTIYTYIF